MICRGLGYSIASLGKDPKVYGTGRPLGEKEENVPHARGGQDCLVGELG